MIKAIFFDFYGTIGIYNDIKNGDKETWEIIYNYISNKKVIDYNEFLNKWNKVFNTNLTLTDIEKECIFIDKLYRIFKLYDINISNKELNKLGERCLKFWHSYISIPIDIHEVLRELRKKYKLAIVSNYDHPKYLRHIIKENRLDEYFDYIIISGEIGISKPDRKIYEKALNELNVKPSEVMFVGDSLKDDIEGAINVGCHPILIDMEEKHKDYLDIKIRKISDLLNINLC